LVVRYAYLWHSEKSRGQSEGLKNRPCAVIVTTRNEQGREVVRVLPITHRPPADPALALEIPIATKSRLGLDGERSWIVLSEFNQFVWPGPDLRPAVNGQPETAAYGSLPRHFYRHLRDRFVAVLEVRRSRAVKREE